MALHKFVQGGCFMTIRRYLPLFTLSLLNACGSNGGDSVNSDNAATSTQAIIDSHSIDGDDNGEGRAVKVSRVLLISVDGLHETDAARFIAANPKSTMAQLAKKGVEYTNAHTPTPSDSFPGLLALVTGGTPKTTGVYYDDSYDRTLYSPGSNCAGAPGTEIVYDESVDKDLNQLFSGGIAEANLPLSLASDGSCKPVYPHEFLKVNTIFEV